MFAGLIKQAMGAATGLVFKYVARASIALPFVIALGFALAAISVLLVQRFGHVFGYWMIADGLTLIGHRNHCLFSQRAERLRRKRLTGRGTRHAKTSDRGRITKLVRRCGSP